MSAPVSSVRFFPLATAAGRYMVRCAKRPAAEPALPLAYDPLLYLTPAYLAQRPAPGEEVFFYLEEQAEGRTVAQWPVVVQGEVAYSPGQAPFGGVQLAPAVPEVVVRAFLQVAHAQLAAQGVGRVHVRTYPTSYDPAGSALLLPLWEELGYRATRVEESHALPLHTPYEAGLHPSARRRLRKCQRHGLQVEQETPLLLPLAHEYLQRWRAEKGQGAPFDLEHLQALFRAFPHHYSLFSVRAPKGEWVALTVLIAVNSRVLYVLQPGSPLSYNTFSPVILLMQGLHAFGQASGYELLDLGTSMLPNGAPHASLQQFKRHLGATPSPQRTLEAFHVRH